MDYCHYSQSEKYVLHSTFMDYFATVRIFYTHLTCLPFVYCYSYFLTFFFFLLLTFALIVTTYFGLTLALVRLTVLCPPDMPIGNLHNQNHKVQINEIFSALTTKRTIVCRLQVCGVYKCYACNFLAIYLHTPCFFLL